ncbi:hypothetical protein [Rathayibacter toxicus]|uniref:hypothetical protein n=1 Tax=Rathayibacter toxicus TaxID=145458 RepID=UPI000CE85DC8|nr:hypothetical protein [Rathayibacter toxicus]PPH58367.1 hypothetical protein C5C93_10010 [Rathayibacter toxicus]PPI65062.1 hypothetical protein C5D47_09975 [Rathayibacter toxicus]QWL48411.1 hypothetical protein E2R43_01385 [Rathayibacter toxicus]QWL52807.1 hypothetical protein E2R45_01380 [Rathayibacter toxicus]
MTEKPTETHNIEIAGTGWSIPAEDGVHRRTLVKGMSWTVPIAATALATPAFAASPQPTLKFTQDSYSGTACGTISGAQVKRTVDGTAPDSGKTVKVTLSDGYTFANGSTTYSGTTDANGLITLPDIKVPAKGGNSSFSASSDKLTATAAVSAPKNTKSQQVSNTTAKADGPSDATPLNSGYWLKDGTLYFGTTAVKDSSGTDLKVASTSTGWYATNTTENNYIAVQTTDGKAYQVNSSTAKIAGPDGATPLNSGYWLKDGTLYFGTTAIKDSTGADLKVASTSTGWYATNTTDNNYIAVQTTDGKAYQVNNSTATIAGPDGATPLNSGYWLKDGTLYFGTTAIKDSTGADLKVASTSTGWYATNTTDNNYIAVQTTDGKAYQVNNSTAKIAGPDGATPLNSGYWLKDGTLYFGTTSVTSNVTATSDGWYASNANNNYIAISTASC